MPTPRTNDFDIRFLGGMESSAEPGTLGSDFFARGMNVTNRGGIVQCRPGYRCRTVLPAGNFQGGKVFRPKSGDVTLLFGVEGVLYSSPYPFLEVMVVPDVAFIPHSRQLFFQQAEQSIQFNSDGSLTLISPRNVMVIQDGGFSPPAVFDGTSAEHQRGAGAIPLGGAMAWSGDRLWVARGSSLFASDIANPFSFREPEYFATVTAFSLPGEITAMAEVPNADIAQLLVFTDSTTTLMQSGVRNRAVWNTTANFQRILFPAVGCVSQQSITTHLGLLWWYSAFGLTSLDSASFTRQTSVLPYRDNEMADSKGRMSPDVGGVAMGVFENYLMVSVPYCDSKNRHTWVLDQAPLQRGGGASSAAWNSVWTGTRPAQWIYGSFGGTEQIFHISKDFDGNNRLWESFTPDRLDDGCPITWYMETRGIDGGLPLQPKKFRYATAYLRELYGQVDVGIFWAGVSRGKYKSILKKRINASIGSIRTGEVIRYDSLMFGLKKQMRDVRTEDAQQTASATTLTSTDVESPDAEFIDEAFQLLIVGSGPGAVAGIRYFMEPPAGTAGSNSPDKEVSGAVEKDETEENFVRFDGAAAESHVFADALASFENDIPKFTSNKTATVVQSGITAVGTGFAESVISQQDADKIAECVARKVAVQELQISLPKIVSVGLSLA
jgi:hypothetical protein